jgi:hypothetical protein
MLDAIIDSGASYTYVTQKVPLSDRKKGGGSVWTANGQKEDVAEIGDAGPLSQVRKVNSFTRTLISVGDLADQFGGVYFDSNGSHVISEASTGWVATKIGRRNPSRLYTFDVESLIKHKEKIVLGDVSCSSINNVECIAGLTACCNN